jgi:TRAP-type C4-dicarboxylate transport system permease small subunit
MIGAPNVPTRTTSFDIIVERWASRTLGLVTALTLFAMMVLTFVDVWGRYLLRQPVFGGYEVTEFLMGVLIFSGLPILCAREGHVSIDVFDTLIPGKWRRWQLMAVNLVGATALGLLAWRMFIQAGELWRNNEVTMTLKIPHGPFCLLFAVLSAAACVACLAVFWAYLRGQRQPIQAEQAP